MFRIATVFFFLFVGFYAHGQDVKIVDQHFKEVPFCDIYSVDELEFFQSDENGKIDINSFQEDVQYVFSTLGFEEDTLSRKELEALKNHTLTLISDECVIKDVIVTAPSRKKQKLSAIPSKVDVITQEKIYEYGSQTSADILSQSNEVFVQKSQLGGGSPVIRGFEASRVLLVMDGVRLNNAIYRSGHLQNSITLDPLILDRAEVIFGPTLQKIQNLRMVKKRSISQMSI